MREGDDELSRVRQQLSDLEDVLRAGFWELELATMEVSWSPGLYRLYGVDPVTFDATLDAWAALSHPEDRGLIEATTTAAIERGGDYDIDHRYVRADDGSLRWAKSRGRVVPAADGAPERILGVSIDTTDDHRAAEVHSSFIAHAAHELRTPAAAISQAVQALLVTDDEATRDEIVAALARQSTRLRQLTTNLVDLAAVEAEREPAELHLVPLAPAVAHALALSDPPADRDVTVDVPDDLLVRAEEQQLDRVLVNVLTNAWRYGGATVVVSAVADGDSVAVTVRDDGDGVPADLAAALFEPFRRGPQRHPEASGLGLAIVDRLMRRFGGRVEHEPGDPGATFRLVFEGTRTGAA